MKFAHDQKLIDPRDGLMLYGPFDKGRGNNFSVGIIGTPDGQRRFKRWMSSIQKPVFYPKPDMAKPFFPGFEEVYGIRFNDQQYTQLTIDPEALERFFRYTDDHVRIASIVDLYADRLISYKEEADVPVSLWFVIIPDMVYQLCRPMSKVPKSKDTLSVGIRDVYSRQNPGLFEDENTRRYRDAYHYEKHFHNQLKLKLLRHGILTQVIKESTIAYQDFLDKNGNPKKDLSAFETDIAWSLTTSIYYKVTGLPPWKLADIRKGVCYIGLVFKNDDRNEDRRIACCAAQMFLDSGDGQVFKGAVGPWYNPDTKEYHLTKDGAKDLLTKALAAYKQENGVPREVFIHGRTYFDDNEWQGFLEAAAGAHAVVGIKISHETTFKLFRASDFPVMRGTVYVKDARFAYLWTKGFIPRLQTVVGLETPNPLQVQITRGDANILTVCKDVLALTKLNYNTCRFADGEPVTLKFADTIGEILTAGPNDNVKVLPFKYYI
ncbi:hypothetical protein K3G63_11215 [Hymenobacter sp. HSC-4F20]|uniref:hypothetical protein n=1 Tax=Hymenobacter sp. HSC-4F20 TaxID=2864135 RepID=UPI001C73105A|nr:hypothetical protein [Hymenobacter sp. HSC-4F20]MBX0291013.1 hypothetical protein [Hymenobacter sp. HSC-4F20]